GPGAPADQAERGLERIRPAPRAGSGAGALGSANHPGAPSAGSMGSPGAAAGHVPNDGLPPQRPPIHGPLLLLAGTLLRARRPRAPLPREPRARRQRREAGRRRLRVPDGALASGGAERADRASPVVGPSGGAARPSRHSGVGPYFVSTFFAMAT